MTATNSHTTPHAAFNDGIRAYYRGDSEHDNPFAERTACGQMWDEGWAWGEEAKAWSDDPKSKRFWQRRRRSGRY